MAMVCFAILSRAQQHHFNLLIGTYTNSCDSNGIYVYDFDTESAEFKIKASVSAINPSYISISKSTKFLYSVNENGAKSTISAYRFKAANGDLSFINQQNSEGADPCYLINDAKNIIVANYSGGNICVFGRNNDGSISSAKQVIKHYGKSINLERQQSAHVHMVQFTPDKKFVVANDLGTDKLYIYRYDPKAASKILVIKDSIFVKAGSGPRHLTFSPNGKFGYLLQELDGSLTVFSYDKGYLSKIQESTVVRSDFKGDIGAADIHISADGKFLYATNRGAANDISLFEIQKDGRLKFKERQPTLGKGPRNFTIDPSGNFLLVAHQYSNSVVIFKINRQTGELTDSGKRIELCAPVCLVFTP